MGDLKFEWDFRKNNLNINKHKVSFEEAKTVFFNEMSAISYDPDHSKNEDHFIVIGFSSFGRVLLVCFCERNNGNVIRIISARKLTKREIKEFNKGLVK